MKTQGPTRKDRLAHREAGAVMLVVMMVLLVVTASATLAVYSSQFEIRAAGHQRQAMQTAQIAESGLTAVTTTIEMRGGARVLEYQMNQAPTPVGTRLAPEEPPLGAMNSRNVRFVSSQFVFGTPGLPLQATAAESRGFAPFEDPRLMAFEPRFVVDVNDAYNISPTFVGTAAGTRVDGNGAVQLRYLVTTVTSRGRMARNGMLDARGGYATGVFTGAEAARPDHLRRDIFETSVTARAVTVSGPYTQ